MIELNTLSSIRFMTKFLRKTHVVTHQVVWILLFFLLFVKVILNFLCFLCAGKEFFLNLSQVILVFPLLFRLLEFLLINPDLAGGAVPCAKIVDILLGHQSERVCALRMQPAAVRTVIFTITSNEKTTCDCTPTNTKIFLMICSFFLFCLRLEEPIRLI